MWVWKFIQPGVQNEHGGAEHDVVQQWVELRSLFRNAVRQRSQMVPLWLHHRHRHQRLRREVKIRNCSIAVVVNDDFWFISIAVVHNAGH